MSAHTPGPWTVLKSPSGYNHIRTGKPEMDGLCLRICSVNSADVSETEEAANARLIAAAPKMKLALERVMKAFAPMGTEGLSDLQKKAIGSVMNALAKANGEA